MRVFVTGATGFIGSAVVKELLEAGHEVVGLARSDGSAQKLKAAGARVHRGGIEDLESLRQGALGADAAIHTAFFHEITQMSLGTRMRVFLGGSPGGIVMRFLKAAVDADRRAIETLGRTLSGPDRALVAAFGTLAMKAGQTASEEDSYDPNSAGGARGVTEKAIEALARQGIRASAIRLPPMVHGEGDRGGLAARLGKVARKRGFSAYLGEGENRWPSVHRLDAARLFRLALEKGVGGAKYHAVAEEGVPFRSIAEIIGRRLHVPVVSKSVAQGSKLYSWLAPFISVDNPVSSKLTRERLGWTPTQPQLIEDLDRPGYFEQG